MFLTLVLCNGMELMFYIGFTFVFCFVEMLTLYCNKKTIVQTFDPNLGTKRYLKGKNFDHENPLLFCYK